MTEHTLEHAKNEAAKLKAEARQAAENLDSFKAETDILRAAEGRFCDPKTDILPVLLAGRKAVAIGDGETENRFQIASGGNYLSLDQALDTLATNRPYYLKPQLPKVPNEPTNEPLRRSQMTNGEKVAFVNAHGVEAFKKLRA